MEFKVKFYDLSCERISDNFTVPAVEVAQCTSVKDLKMALLSLYLDEDMLEKAAANCSVLKSLDSDLSVLPPRLKLTQLPPNLFMLVSSTEVFDAVTEGKSTYLPKASLPPPSSVDGAETATPSSSTPPPTTPLPTPPHTTPVPQGPAPKTAITDLYGFELSLTQQEINDRNACDAIASVEARQWHPYMETHSLPSGSSLKTLIRKGIPPAIRPWVWMETSGAAKKKAAYPDHYYQTMVTAGQASPFANDIAADAKFTFQNHAWLQSSEGQDPVQRVLRAYSVHNPKVGYCRSMNTIVALLLVVVNHQEDTAFWLLAALVEDILYQGTFSANLEGCQVEMRALDELLQRKMPELGAHLSVVEADISVIGTDWYLCLFCRSLPPESAVRVWDALFNEGPKVLFRVSLALFKMNEVVLRQCDNDGDVMIQLRESAHHLHHRDALMMVAFEGIGGLPQATLDKYRTQKEHEVQDMIAERTGAEPASAQGSEEKKKGITKERLTAGFGKLMGNLKDKFST